MNRVGRNEPCPCGSNVKFKRCCGDANKMAEQVREARRLAIEKEQNPEAETVTTITVNSEKETANAS